VESAAGAAEDDSGVELAVVGTSVDVAVVAVVVVTTVLGAALVMGAEVVGVDVDVDLLVAEGRTLVWIDGTATRTGGFVCSTVTVDGATTIVCSTEGAAGTSGDTSYGICKMWITTPSTIPTYHETLMAATEAISPRSLMFSFHLR